MSYDPAAHQRRMRGEPQQPTVAGQPQYPYSQQLPPVFPPGYRGEPQPPHGYYPPPQQPAAPARKPGRRRRGALMLIFFAVIIFAVIAIVSGGGGGGASYKAHVVDTVVINPADLAVTVQVTNTGKTAGTPTCKVQANDPSYTYTGFDEGTLTSAVQQGATTTYVDNVTITHEGAQYITNVTASC